MFFGFFFGLPVWFEMILTQMFLLIQKDSLLTNTRQPLFTAQEPHPSLPPFVHLHASFFSWNVEMTSVVGMLLSLLLTGTKWTPLLTSLIHFATPSSSLQLLLKPLRLTKVNGSGRPLLLLPVAIDRGLRWVFIHSCWCLNRVCLGVGANKSCWLRNSKYVRKSRGVF